MQLDTLSSPAPEHGAFDILPPSRSAVGVNIIALDKPAAPPLTMPARFRMEIVYFMTPPGDRGAPPHLPDGEYWIDAAEARTWLDEGVVYVVSPLDAENQAEIELTEYHEAFLQWLVTHGVQHVKVA